MAIAKISSGAAAATGSFLTLNTVGATLLFLAQSANGATGPTPSDNQGNTWTPGPLLSDATVRNEISTFYVLAPVTSATHTFTSSAAFGSGYVGAFSGTLTSSATDGTSNHSNAPNSTTETSGSITTTGGADIVFAAWSLDDNALSGAPTINAGMTVDGFVNNAPGSLYGIAVAFVILTSTSTVAPTLTRTNPAGANNRSDNAVMIAFKATATAAVPYNPYINNPQLASILAQKRDRVGWSANDDHRWRRWRKERSGLVVPTKKLILPKAA